MSTLTASTTLRSDHCIHKLPTSCKLTASPTCCACQDRRAQAPSYEKYVDGVGFVAWGTRQERYCWPCREFWNIRVQISGMRQSDTRIPERPDISLFLTKWYDWHRGYRVIKRDDGTEQHQAMVGESLENAAHGYLPRSTEELRRNMLPGEQEVRDRGGRVEEVPREPVVERPRIDLDSEDEHLFDSTDDEEEQNGQQQQQSQPSTATNGNGRHVPSNIEHGHLAELVGDQPRHTPEETATGPQLAQQRRPNRGIVAVQRESDGMAPLRIAREHYQRVTALRRELQRMRVGIERVMSGLQGLEVDVPDSQSALDQINELNGRLSRYREAPLDLPEVNNPDYQSPLSTMFERAWRRHDQVQSDRIHAIAAQDGLPIRNEQGRIVQQISDVSQGSAITNAGESGIPAPNRSLLIQFADTPPDPSGGFRNETSTSRQSENSSGQPVEEPRFLGLDEPGRPDPIVDEEAFKIDNRCDVCLQQIATVATFPCGHMVMCTWCADEVIPRHANARNIPRDPAAKCPQCRRKVRHIYTVRVRVAKEGTATVVHKENQEF